MRKTCFGGILLLCALAVAKPAKAAEQEAIPTAQAVETVIIQDEASDPEISESASSLSETASWDAAEVQRPGENDKTPQEEPEDIPELKDDPEPDTDSIPEDGSDLNSDSIPESSSDLNSDSIPEGGSDLNSDSIPEGGSDLNSDSASGNNSGPAANPEHELEPVDEILTEEAVSDPNKQNIGLMNAQDSDAVTKQASNAAASGVVSAAGEKISDRIHFITLNGESHDSDAILIESNGKYGLIDSSNPSDVNDKFRDDKANGLSVVRYLTDINVNHLTFILATHAHSDHNGGMPDVAASGLVDSGTVYIYKPCETPDEVCEGENNENSRYFNTALQAMAAQGAALLNVQNRTSDVMRALGADYVDDPKDSVGSHIAFTMGDFLIKLFNLGTESYTNENLNSIITTVQKNEMRAVLMADMEMTDHMESRVVDCIIRNDGTSRTDVYKMGHHYFDTSNSLDTIKTLNPKYCVQSTKTVSYRTQSGIANYYFLTKNGNKIYRTSQNDPAIIAEFGDREVSLLRKASNGIMTSATSWKTTIYDGFYEWYPNEDSYNLTGAKLTYFKSGEALKGWFKVGNSWYYANNDYIIQTGWQKLDGKEYYFNDKGVMKTGWLSDGGKWYYLSSSGAMSTGWINDGGKWYYMDSTGAMITGWQTLDGKRYYFNGSGVMQTGWLSYEGSWYYLSSSGAMSTGWINDGGKWYYMDKTGPMVTGWINDSGKRYYFNGSGVMQTGWLKDGGKWYYLSSSGAMATGWINDGGKWYYMDKTGPMVTGWIIDSGKRYYFNSSGVMQTGWLKDSGKWYYLNSSGAMATGWINDGGKWYYMDGTGAMSTGWINDGGKRYYFNSSGVMQTGWLSDGGKWYYLDGNGAMVTNKWIGDYYLKSNGEMAVSQWIDGYYVGADGKWIKDYKAA